MSRQIKLLGHVTISGEIEALSGLHIGGIADSIDKGGIDHPVIKNPVTNEPYIPGSSLRGRMRSLLEKKVGNLLYPMTSDIWMEMYEKIEDARSSEVCRVFGNSESEPGLPSILIVRDALYTERTKKDFMSCGLPKTEAKIEIAVDRITAHALPRTIERVPAGARFDFSVVYKVQKDESWKESVRNVSADLENILWSLEEIEMHDGLGGNTSRGHGHVRIHLRSLTVKNFADPTQKGLDLKAVELDNNKMNANEIDKQADYQFREFLEAVQKISDYA